MTRHGSRAEGCGYVTATMGSVLDQWAPGVLGAGILGVYKNDSLFTKMKKRKNGRTRKTQHLNIHSYFVIKIFVGEKRE